MALPKIIPALADLTQDIAGPLPIELLQSWASGNQNATEAERLLDTYRRVGTVVASDTSGLSRLTEERDLLDVLALVSGPKQTVHGLGVAVGGRPIGIWTADNTEMYYPTSVPTRLVIDAMAEAQSRIARESPLRIGMCVHHGEFFEVGGGLYGRDAETVQRLAEDFADPGVVLVTRAIRNHLGDDASLELTPRPDLTEVHAPGVFGLSGTCGQPDLRADQAPYPHPFPAEFFADLNALRLTADVDSLRRRIYDAYLRDRVIVVVAKAGAEGATGGLTALLDGFVDNALMETIVRVTMRAGDHVAGFGAGLAILTFDTPSESLEFADAVRTRFRENGVEVKIGIDRGPVLMFGNQRGSSGISGDPVNIASKLSEDAGAVGKIRISSRAIAGLPMPAGAEPFAVTVSRIALSGVEL